MLPQLKWCILNDAGINQIPFGAKKGVSNVIIEDLGGWRGRNVAEFFEISQKYVYLPENKKNTFLSLFLA